MFPREVGVYVDLMQDLIPEMQDGTIQTAVDTGYGVNALLSHSFIELVQTIGCSAVDLSDMD